MIMVHCGSNGQGPEGSVFTVNPPPHERASHQLVRHTHAPNSDSGFWAVHRVTSIIITGLRWRRRGHAAKRQTGTTCQVTKESLAPQWHLFSLLVGMPFYLFGEWRCLILRCGIDGFMDVSRRLFPRVSISLSVCWHRVATPLSSFSFIIVTPSFWLLH